MTDDYERLSTPTHEAGHIAIAVVVVAVLTGYLSASLGRCARQPRLTIRSMTKRSRQSLRAIARH
jgi:hypothetical protein